MVFSFLIFLENFFTANDFEGKLFSGCIVLILTIEDHHFAVRKITEALLLCNFEKQINQFIAFGLHVLWNLITDDTSAGIQLSYNLAVGGACQNWLLGSLFAKMASNFAVFGQTDKHIDI